jgi:hypothetical protein
VTLKPSELPKGSPTRRMPDISKLQAIGYEPKVSLLEALWETLSWYRESSRWRHERPTAHPLRGLRSADLELVLSLGSSPPTCVMVPVGTRQATEDHHPLELLRCHDCTLVQLSVVIDPEIVFPPAYPYSSGNSRMLHENFEDLARQASGWMGGLVADDLVVDIGANDGTLLSKFDCRTVGVEPTGQVEKINGPVYQTFFDRLTAEQIRRFTVRRR